jgi:carbon storage regulator
MGKRRGLGFEPPQTSVWEEVTNYSLKTRIDGENGPRRIVKGKSWKWAPVRNHKPGDSPITPAANGTMPIRTSGQESTMLVLSRKKNESIVIDDRIVITVVEIRGDKVRLGIQAPRDVPVHRQEVYEALRKDAAQPPIESPSSVS